MNAIKNFLCKLKSVAHFLQETQYASIPWLLPSIVQYSDKPTGQCWWQCTNKFKCL